MGAEVVQIAGAVAAAGTSEVNSKVLPNAISENGKEYMLMGTGTRTKFMFKVYALGVYVEKAEMEKEMKTLGKAAVEKMKKDKKLSEHMMSVIEKHNLALKCVIVFLRDLEGSKMTDGMCDSLSDHMGKDKVAAEKPKIAEILPPTDNIKEKDVFIMDLQGACLKASKNGKEVKTFADGCKELNTAIQKIYFTTTTVNDIKDNLMKKAIAIAA